MPKSKPTRKTKRFTPPNRWRSPLRLVNFALVFAIIGTLFLIFSSAAPLPGFYGSVEQDQVNRINSRRASIGRGGLSHIECLNSKAENWTKKMAAAGKISHNPNLANEATYACGGYWTVLGENVGVGYGSSQIFGAFMNSTAHKANIEDGRFTRVGVGGYWHTDGRLYITQVFGTCSDCSGGWNTAATLPADPVAPAPATTTGNTFYLKNSNSGGVADFTFKYGNPGDVALFCDWDGNGTDTVGVYRNTVFYLSNNNSTAALSFGFGGTGDIPVCGDWNGDGKDTIGVFRPSNATFYLRNSNNVGGVDITAHYGGSTDKPIVGDWNGDGIDTIGITRGTGFYLRNSNTSGVADITFGFGGSGDIPIVGDWDGNRTTTIGVFRPSNATFYLRNSNSVGGVNITAGYGNPADKPAVGDWDGNGTTTIGIRR